MKPGERVDLIKKLAGALGPTSFANIDLVLRQFGFPWSDRWDGGDLEYYAQYHLEKGKDEQLLALDEYLFPTAAAGAPTPTGRWSPGALPALDEPCPRR